MALVAAENDLELDFFAAMAMASPQPMFYNSFLTEPVVRSRSLIIFEALSDVSHRGLVELPVSVLGWVGSLTSWTNRLTFSS